MQQDHKPASKAALKDVRALHQKKGRLEQQRFLVEGLKSVEELLRSDWPVLAVYCSADAWQVLHHLIEARGIDCYVIAVSLLESLSTLSANDQVVAVAMMRPSANIVLHNRSRLLALDDISDPGNLGTMLRLADWYGLDGVVCSPNCVDRYNSKVIGASMGSFLRVPMMVTPLPLFLATAAAANLAVIGAVLSGQNVHQTQTQMPYGVLVIGSESNGLSTESSVMLTHRVTIPSFGQAESLNAAIASGILLDHWRQKSP